MRGKRRTSMAWPTGARAPVTVATLVVACIVSVCAVAGCGGGGKASAGSGSGTLTVWSWGSTTKTLKALTPQFEKAHRGAHVKLVDQPLNSYPTLVQSAIASRRGPDVIQTYGSPSVFDYQRGLLPLDKYVTPAQKKDLLGWSQVSTGLDANGTPYAVPFLSQGFVWYYNKALFRKAGLDPAAPPTTWADMLSACRQLKSKGVTPIVAGFKDGYLGEDYLGHFAAMLMTDDQLRSFGGNPNWTQPAFIKAWGFLRQLYTSGCFTPKSEGITLFPQAADQFGAGKGAMFYGLGSDTANFAQYKPTLGSDLGVWRGPTVPGSQFETAPADFAPNLAWGVTRWSKQADLAYAWISFVTSKTAQEKGFETLGSLPNNVQSRPHTSYAPANQVLALMRSPNRVTNPDFSIRSSVEATLDRVIPQVLTGRLDPAAAMQQVQQSQEQLRPIPTR